MNLLLSLLLFALVVDSCCPWRLCRNENWWDSFQRKGWSKCTYSDEYITGFYRSHRSRGFDPISRLEEAQCCEASSTYSDSSTCRIQDWWHTLDRKYVWAKCPRDHFLQGLYRSVKNHLYNIEEARCCKPEGQRWGRCEEKGDWTEFDKENWFKCRYGYYMVGFYKGKCNELYCLERIFCCQMSETSCGSPHYFPFFLNGYKIGSDYRHGRTVRYYCYTGYTLQGEDEITCDDGTWDSNPPECKDVNECANYPCRNGGTCLNLQGSYRCDCKSGYSGNNCETDVNECSNNPCRNGANCKNLQGSYRCECKPGYYGNNCERDVNECANKPCKNGATCVNLQGSYRCDCKSGYSGNNCETG